MNINNQSGTLHADEQSSGRRVDLIWQRLNLVASELRMWSTKIEELQKLGTIEQGEQLKELEEVRLHVISGLTDAIALMLKQVVDETTDTRALVRTNAVTDLMEALTQVNEKVAQLTQATKVAMQDWAANANADASSTIDKDRVRQDQDQVRQNQDRIRRIRDIFLRTQLLWEEHGGSLGIRIVHGDATGMERVFATDESEMIAGLATRFHSMENTSESQRIQQVYEAFKPFAEGKPLPPGTTKQLMRFLVVSAWVPGLWQRMDELDPRLGNALLGSYAEGLGMTKLAERLPDVNNSAMAGYLVRRGLKQLYTLLPEQSDDFPLDKRVEFPLDSLMNTRRDRQRVAGEKRAAVSRSSEWGRTTVGRRWWPASEENH